MFHILLFLLHRRFKEAYFNLIRSANCRRQMLLLLRAAAWGGGLGVCSLTAARCRFSTPRGLKPLCPICDRRR